MVERPLSMREVPGSIPGFSKENENFFAAHGNILSFLFSVFVLLILIPDHYQCLFFSVPYSIRISFLNDRKGDIDQIDQTVANIFLTF